MIDEFCYLVISVFGGLKNIKNNTRIINNIVVIAQKVFEFECKTAPLKGVSRIGFTLEDILQNSVEPVYTRLHRLVFHNQTQNMAFVDELFELIVKKLHKVTNQYVDGSEKTDKGRVDLFDFEAVLQNPVLLDLRSNNLKRFLKDFIENILENNLDCEKRRRQ